MSDTPIPSDALARIGAANDRFARHFAEGDVQALVGEFYAPDALIAGEPMVATGRGTEAMRAFLQGMRDGGFDAVRFETVEVDTHPGGAIEVGRALVSGAGNEAAIRYMVVWEAASDGTWRAAADFFAPEAAADPA